MATISGTCDKENCTWATTGTCLLSHSKLTDCPNFKPSPGTRTAEEKEPELIATTAEPQPRKTRTFHSGLELGTEDAAVLMRQSYTHLIGILGSWNAGKTCFLSSLYLMAANGSLRPGYTFCSSQTLQGFEDRARLTREWESDATLPETLADHTVLSDPRRPSLLHLALKRAGRDETLNLLFTDLPGEWSRSLIDHKSRAASFKFLNRAEVVLIVIDCPLLESDTRFAEIQRAKQLIERLATDVALDRSIPIVLILAKADMIDMRQPALVQQLMDLGASFGFKMDVIPTAAFSSKPLEIDNGKGVVTCLDKILEYSRTLPPDVGVPPHNTRGPRMFEQFRSSK